MWIVLGTGYQIRRTAKSEQTSGLSNSDSIANYSHLFLKEIPFMKNFTVKQQEILGLKTTYYIKVKVIFYLLLYFCLKTTAFTSTLLQRQLNKGCISQQTVTLANISKYINLCLRTAREKELFKYPEECFSTKRPIHNLRPGQKYLSPAHLHYKEI